MKKLLARLYEKEAKETLWSLATKGLAAVLFIALNTYLARVLGVELWGSWSFLLSNLTIVFLLSYLGQTNAARAFAAQNRDNGNLRAVLRDSLTLRLAISIVFTLAFLLLHRQIAGWVRRPDSASLFLLATPLVFFAGFSEYFKQIFTGLHRLKYHFIINTVEFGLKISLAVLLLSMTISLENVLLSHWLAVLAASLVGFYFWGVFYRREPLPASETRFIKPIFQYSMPLFLIGIGFLILTEIDTLMLGLLSNDYEVGLFAVGKQLANKLPQLALALSMGTMPTFANLTDENRERMYTKFKGIIRLNSIVFLPIGAGMILFAPWFVPLLFGEAYTQSVLPLQILTVWIVLTTYNMFFNALLDYQGLASRRAMNFLLSMIATVALNFYLIPLYGATGAAFATSIAFIPYFILNWLEVRKVFKG